MSRRLSHIAPSSIAVLATAVLLACGGEPGPGALGSGAEPVASPAGEAPAEGARSGRLAEGTPSGAERSGGKGAGSSDDSSDPDRVHRIVRVRGRARLPYAFGPGRRASRRLTPRTRFGTRRALSVVRERGGWLGLAVEERPNGRLAWVRAADPRLSVSATPLSLHADLSRRQLELRRGSRRLAAMPIGVGRAENRTPTGRYAVTDRLSGRDFPDAYGCCILALTGHQTRTPAGWKGGDRLAIHGTNAPHSLGRASSSGCMRAPRAELRRLMRTVPIGTPVFVER